MATSPPLTELLVETASALVNTALERTFLYQIYLDQCGYLEEEEDRCNHVETSFNFRIYTYMTK